MQLGNKIRDLRQQINLTQEELADRCELTKGYISQLENDVTSPSIATLIDILNALGTNLSDFFHEEAEEKIVFSQEEYIEKQSDGMLWHWVIPNAQKTGWNRYWWNSSPEPPRRSISPTTARSSAMFWRAASPLYAAERRTRPSAAKVFTLRPAASTAF